MTEVAKPFHFESTPARLEERLTFHLVRELLKSTSRASAELDTAYLNELNDRNLLKDRWIVSESSGLCLAREIRPDGALAIELPSGSVSAIRSGSVRLRETHGSPYDSSRNDSSRTRDPRREIQGMRIW